MIKNFTATLLIGYSAASNFTAPTDLSEKANFEAWLNEGGGLRAAVLQGDLTEEERQALMTSRLPIRAVEGRSLQDSYQCSPGYFYYDSWGLCSQCGEGCMECSSRRSCSSCENPYDYEMYGSCHCDNSRQTCLENVYTTCRQGTYHNSYWNECQSCSWKCQDCDSYVQCNTCAPGYTQNSWGECMEIPRTCPDSTYIDDGNGNCVCPLHTHDTGSSCVVCYENMQWDPVAKRCIDNVRLCARGKYMDIYTSQCENCYSNCASCDYGQGICNECANSDYIMNDHTCTCPDDQLDLGNGLGCEAPRQVVVCTDGQYLSSNTKQCESCFDNCETCDDGMGECNTCKDTFQLIRGACQCPFNYDLENGVCVIQPDAPDSNCGPGEADYGYGCQPIPICDGPGGSRSAGGCRKCPVGQFLSVHHNLCQFCSDDCASCDDGFGYCNRCTHPSLELGRKKFSCNCPWGWERDDDGRSCKELEPCGRGFYRDWFSGACTTCGEHCEKCLDKFGQCAECKDSTYENHFYKCACPRGHTDSGNGCKSECPDSFFLDFFQPRLDGGYACEKCGENCAKCDDMWGYCTECEDSSYCMNKRTCSCLDGQEIVNGKCVFKTEEAPCPPNFDVNDIGRCCECKSGTNYDSGQAAGSRCSCNAPATIDRKSMKCICDQWGATYIPNKDTCDCDKRNGAEFDGSACVCIDTASTNGLESLGGDNEDPDNWVCKCDDANAYIDPTDGYCICKADRVRVIDLPIGDVCPTV